MGIDFEPSVLIIDLYPSGPHARRYGGGLQELGLPKVGKPGRTSESVYKYRLLCRLQDIDRKLWELSKDLPKGQLLSCIAFHLLA